LYVVWRAGEWALNQVVYENKSFAIRDLDVQTDGVISIDQLRRWSGVKPGQNLLALDLARVKEHLEMVPLIRSASIERVLPGTLRIRVVERQPVAQVNAPRPRPGGEGIEVLVYHIDADGYVMVPLDPRQRAVPLSEAHAELPLISGLSASVLQPGRRIDLPALAAGLQLIREFDSSPLAGLTDLRRIDVGSPRVLAVTTGQASEIVFALENFERQLLRWHRIFEECRRYNRTIATLDLAVGENTPLRMQDASIAPLSVPPRKAQPSRTRKKNV
jgi:hypothetical protein